MSLNNVMEIKQRPKVGVGVYILNSQNQLLLMFEKRPDTGGTWAPPGGHLEFCEEVLDCAKREAKEEMDLEVTDAELWSVNNNIKKPDWHYVNFDFVTKSFKGEPKIMEPHKCEKFAWFNLNELPKPLLLASERFFGNNPNCLCSSGKKFKECHGKT